MASVGIIRNTKEIIDATPIVDGQILITIDKGDDNKVYADYGNQRIPIGNGRPIDEALNAESDNPIANKAIAGVMLQTMEQIQAVTKSGFLADAKAIKELVEYVTKLSTSVEISWEDYQALSDEEKNSGVVYFIKDYQSGLYTAGREVTRAEYDALTKEQQNNGTLWLITDESNGISALGVDYDNHKSGTKSATVQGALDEIYARLFNNAGAHNAIYRGKNLGTSVTAEQWAVITAGTFDDLYIGDYWVINGKTWRIAAFDYFLHNGDTECTTHHAVIVPDECLYNAQMNTTNDTTGGYVAVKTRGVLTDAETAIKAAFGTSHILSHRVYLTNAVANGKPSGGAWVDTICDLMNEEMVYGTGIFRPTSDGSAVPANYRVEKSQLPLFAHEPSRIINRANYWLRDVVTAAYFAIVYNGGYANYSLASLSRGVRPAFCIS